MFENVDFAKIELRCIAHHIATGLLPKLRKRKFVKSKSVKMNNRYREMQRDHFLGWADYS